MVFTGFINLYSQNYNGQIVLNNGQSVYLEFLQLKDIHGNKKSSLDVCPTGDNKSSIEIPLDKIDNIFIDQMGKDKVGHTRCWVEVKLKSGTIKKGTSFFGGIKGKDQDGLDVYYYLGKVKSIKLKSRY